MTYNPGLSDSWARAIGAGSHEPFVKCDMCGAVVSTRFSGRDGKWYRQGGTYPGWKATTHENGERRDYCSGCTERREGSEMGSNQDIKPITPQEAARRYEEVATRDLGPAVADINRQLESCPPAGSVIIDWSSLPLNLSYREQQVIQKTFRDAGWRVDGFSDLREQRSGLRFYGARAK